MHEILRQIPEHARDSIVIARVPDPTDKSGLPLVVWVNQAFVDLTGYSFDEALGHSQGLLCGPETDLEELGRIQAAILARQSVRAEILYYRKDGTPFWTGANINVMQSEKTGEEFFVSIQRDITSRRQYQEELLKAKETAEAANRAKSSFLAMMSHELRTPLNSILGFAQIMQMEGPNSDHAAEYLSNIRSSGGLLLRVIDDLLDIAKLDSETMDFEAAQFSMDEELQSAFAAWNTRARDKGLVLTLNTDLEHSEYIGDKARLSQVLNNIVLNAIKYTPAGKVQVSVGEEASETDDTICLVAKVRDTGIGIAQKDMERIFTAFERVTSDITSAEEGVGLGLSISKRIVSGLGGTVDVESTLGEGSTFTLRVPLKLAESSRQQTPEQTPSFVPIRPMGAKVLVAEDNPMNQRVIQSLLQALGYEFDIVENGKQAVKAANSAPYDLVLMDISMPVMSGDMATRVIRAMDTEVRELPIIAVTAHAMKGDKEKYMSAGFTDYLPKPIDVASLAGILAKHLGGEEAVA